MQPRHNMMTKISGKTTAAGRLEAGRTVHGDYQPGASPRAEPEYPGDKAADARGGRGLGTFRASHAAVPWSSWSFAGRPARVQWAEIALSETPAAGRPRGQLAIYQPRGGKSPAGFIGGCLDREGRRPAGRPGRAAGDIDLLQHRAEFVDCTARADRPSAGISASSPRRTTSTSSPG